MNCFRLRIAYFDPSALEPRKEAEVLVGSAGAPLQQFDAVCFVRRAFEAHGLPSETLRCREFEPAGGDRPTGIADFTDGGLSVWNLPAPSAD